MPTDDHEETLRQAQGASPSSPSIEAELQDRWNATLPNQEAMGADLIRRYSEPHRRYHTTEH